MDKRTRPSLRPSRLAPMLAISLVVAPVAGCSDDPVPDAPLAVFEIYVPDPGSPEAVAFENDITRHIGTAAPVEVEKFDNGDRTYTFDPADGPICMRGDTFRASVRPSDSNDLLIFLQGGGLCSSEFCLAVTSAPPGIPPADLLDADDAANPFAAWDILYLPYCDGSLFSGDNEIDEDMDGSPDRIHHGLQNLTAALTVGYGNFPAPDRVVLAGSSGGGYGTILASFLVRYFYPDVPLYVLNDAGLGLGRSADPSFLTGLVTEFGATEFVPSDCPDCLADGHITSMVDYLLDRDPQVRVAAISSWYDFIIGEIFLKLDPADFRDDLLLETNQLSAEHPQRYRRFIFDGAAHTSLLGDATGIIGTDLGAVEIPPEVVDGLASLELESIHTATANGVLLRPWIEAMIDDDLAGWTDEIETPGPPPAPSP